MNPLNIKLNKGIYFNILASWPTVSKGPTITDFYVSIATCFFQLLEFTADMYDEELYSLEKLLF